MRRFFAVIGLLLVMPLLLPASEFDWLVREFSRETGAKRTNIPFFGVVRFAVAVGHPAGTSQLNLALFEHANFDPPRFSELTDSLVGTAWKPIVRVRSRHGESTNIYAQQNQKDLRLLITSLDNSEATFVQLQVRPEVLIRFVDEHRGSHH
jgi:hypothetical protein